MAYTNLGAFVTRVTLKAISKLDSANVDECMRIAENVITWANNGTITSEQFEQLLAALPVDIMAEEEPEAVEAPIEAEPEQEAETSEAEAENASEQVEDIEAMTKAELLEYADAHGVTAYESWTKAEIIEAIRAAQ